jgi:cyclic-di-GMP-binding protein
MVNINRIGLRIPDQLPPQGTPFFLNDKELTTWVEQLPIANVGETSKLIFKTLRDFNRTQIPSKRRLQSVEFFRQPLSYIAANLSKHYMGSGFPLSDKAYRIAVLNRELHSGLATAYKSAIINLLVESQGKPDRKQLVQAIYQGMNYLSKVILLSALVYDPYPKRIWRELHVLHRLATRYGVESIRVNDTIEDNVEKSTIDEAYRRCILFSLASPYKMRQKDNQKIFDALIQWSHLAKLYSYGEAPEETTIIIRQDTDLAPSHETSTTDVDNKYLLKLDANDLIVQLRDQFSEHPAEKPHLKDVNTLDTGLVRQLIKLLSKAQKRAFVRTKLNFELRIAVGLRSIHKLIALGYEPEKPQEKQEEDGTWIETAFAEGASLKISSHFSLMPMEGESYNPRRGDFEEFGPNSRDFDTLQEPVSQIWEEEPSKLAEPATNTFKTINESAGGYCLDWSGDHIPKIQVGELIGVQSAMSANQFGVGMVRWIRRSPDERLQVGVQMIAPNAMAVSAKKEQQPKAQTHDCLLLPEVGTSGQPTSFICPSYPFKLGNQLQVNEGENLREIKLTRLLEASGSISQFQFVYLDHNDAPDQDDGDEGFGDDTDFDNLWSTL